MKIPSNFIEKVLPRWLMIVLAHEVGVLKTRKFRDSKSLKLHLGCGKVIKEGWINIDLNRKADITLDLRRTLPFSNESAKTIYSEHFLEHLVYPGEVTRLLAESYRILEGGGVFSVGVPDTEWPLVSYVNKSPDYFQLVKEKWHPKWCVTRMEHINYHLRQDGEHKFAYDFETLKYALESAGFADVKRRDFNPSLDSPERRVGTLYVEAFKPRSVSLG